MKRMLDWMKSHHFTEYVYFCRYGIIAAAVILMLPVVAPAMAPTMLGNLFVVNAIGVFFVTLLAVLAAMSAVYVILLTWRSVPARHELAFRRNSSWSDAQTEASSGPILTRPRVVFACALALPIVVVVVWRSSSPFLQAVISSVIGFAAAVLTRELGSMLGDLRVGSRGLMALRRLDRLTQYIPFWRIYQELPEPIRLQHLRAGSFFLAALLVYAVVGFASRPGNALLAGAVPTLAFLLNIVMLLTWVLGVLAFICDRPRVPILVPIAALLLGIQLVAPNDHVYRVVPYVGAPPTETTSDALRARHGGDPDRPLVVVTASGGGIAASLWTGRVLEGLTAALPEFHTHIDMLSAVSGGGVTTMLYADRFTDGSVATTADVARVKQLAAQPSLSAVGWGLAYPDLWRNVVPPLIRESDRGSAQEIAWDQRLLAPGTTLRSWDASVLEGERPLPLFSATTQETGGRLVFSPIRIDQPATGLAWSSGVTRMRTEHLADANGSPIDIRVATAARLSSAFPFVSPHARANTPLANGKLHIADGGYYDNSGIVTAAEIIDAFLTTTPGAELPEKVILIEIRTGEDAAILAERAPKRPSGGIVNAIRGPLDTLYNARTATQISRTRMELDLLETTWQSLYGITLVHAVFQLSGDFPLSWKLTAEEAALIESHWPIAGQLPPPGNAFGDTVRGNRASLANITRHWPTAHP